MAEGSAACKLTNAKADEGPQSVLLARQLQVSRYLDPWGTLQIAWVHSHQIVRGFKVIVNLYDILPPRLNSCLSGCGLGGAFHSGVEVAGTEYAFGGASAEDQGIMALTRPLFVLRREAEELVKAGQDDVGSAAAALGWMPVLRSRAVVGWWLGSLAELDEQVLRPLWLQGRWVGPAYRLLSRNCNHFSRALCGALLAHPSFKAAPGKSDPLRMVPRKVTRLSSLAAALRCCTGRMDSPMPLAPYALNLFQGEPRSIAGDLPPWFRLQQQRLATAAAAAAAAAEEGSREGADKAAAGAGAVIAGAGAGAGAHTPEERGLQRRSAAVNAAAAAAEARAAAAAARASPTRLGGGVVSVPEAGRRTPQFATSPKQATSAEAARRASRDYAATHGAAAFERGTCGMPALAAAATGGVSHGEGPTEAPGFVAEVCSTELSTTTASASASASDGPTLPMPLATRLGPLQAPAGRTAVAAPGLHGLAARSQSGRRVFPHPCSSASSGSAGAGAEDAAADAAADAAVAAVMSSRRAPTVEEGASGAVLPDPAAGSGGGGTGMRAGSGSTQRLSAEVLQHQDGQRAQANGSSAAAGLAAEIAGGTSAPPILAPVTPPGPHQRQLPPARAPLPPLHHGVTNSVSTHASMQGARARVPSAQPPQRSYHPSTQPVPCPDPLTPAPPTGRAGKAPPPPHPSPPPAPSPSPQPPSSEPPRPWSVLSGGFVDLMFDRSAQATPEPPPGVPAPDPRAAQLSLPGAAGAGRAAGDGSAGSGGGGLAAARPATVSGSGTAISRCRSGRSTPVEGAMGTEAGAGSVARAAKARSPIPLQRGSGTGAAGPGKAADAGASVGVGGGAEAAMPTSPLSRYEIMAAMDAIGSSHRASRQDD